MSRHAWYTTTALWVLCGAAVFLQFWPVTSFGFVYDDYHFLRPYDLTDVLRAFHGTWDPAGIEPPFYRPLTVALYAARFEIFGLNEVAHHLVGLLAFAFIGSMAAMLAWRVTGRIATGVWFVLFWTVHPIAPVSLAVWITNQMHLAQTFVIVLSFWIWWHVKSADWRWWIPLLCSGAMALLIKEDGIILLPVLMITHEWYRLLCDKSVPHVPVAFVVSSVVMLAGLYLLRQYVLGGVGGYGFLVTRDRMLTNLLKGPSQTLFLGPVGSLETWVQSCGMTIALVAGAILSWMRRERRHLFLLGVGVLVVLCFDLPFALVTKREQYYALTLGAVMAFAASADILAGWSRPLVRGLATVPLLVVLATMSVRSAAARDLYAPFSDSTLATDRLVSGWDVVPFEIRQWLHRKVAKEPTTTLSRDLPYIVFGAGDVEHDPRGNPFRWTGGRAWINVNSTARHLRFTLRAAGGEHPVRPFIIAVRGGLGNVSDVRLEPGHQQEIDLNLPGRTELLRDMQPVRIVVDHTWTPGPHDPRQLGVILSDIATSDNAVAERADEPAPDGARK